MLFVLCDVRTDSAGRASEVLVVARMPRRVVLQGRRHVDNGALANRTHEGAD